MLVPDDSILAIGEDAPIKQKKALFESDDLSLDLRFVAESVIDGVPSPSVEFQTLDLRRSSTLPTPLITRPKSWESRLIVSSVAVKPNVALLSMEYQNFQAASTTSTTERTRSSPQYVIFCPVCCLSTANAPEGPSSRPVTRYQ